MRVKRFGEFVNEKLFSGIIDRDVSGRSRKEDRILDIDRLKEIICDEIERQETNEIIDLRDLDVSGVHDLSGLFCGTSMKYHDFDVSGWNVSGVKDMSMMFYVCDNFTGKGLETWETGSVNNMNMMFAKCSRLEGDGMKEWDVSGVEDMSGMMYGCAVFDCDVSAWDVSGVYDFNNMFYGCGSFKGKGLEEWKTGKATDMHEMFHGCGGLDFDVSGWDVSGVKDMGFMFAECGSFKGKGLGDWDIGSAGRLKYMFKDCDLSGCDLSGWDVSGVEHIEGMLYNCATGKLPRGYRIKL